MDFDLKHQRDIVALEAHVFHNLSEMAGDILPAIKKGLAPYQEYFNPALPSLQLKGRQKDFTWVVQKHTYANLMALGAFVPQGLKVNYLAYATALQPAAVYASEVLKKLSAYSLHLSALLTNQDAQTKTFPDGKSYTAMAKEREKLGHQVNACFDPKSTRATVNYSQVIDRNADWEKVFEVAKSISTTMDSVDRKALIAKVGECEEFLTLLEAKVKRGELEKISPEALSELSEGAYQMASELEFYSVIYYRVMGYTTAIDQTMAHAIKILAQKAA